MLAESALLAELEEPRASVTLRDFVTVRPREGELAVAYFNSANLANPANSLTPLLTNSANHR